MIKNKVNRLPVKAVIVNPDNSVDFVVSQRISKKKLDQIKDLNSRINNPKLKNSTYPDKWSVVTQFGHAMFYSESEALNKALEASKTLTKKVTVKYISGDGKGPIKVVAQFYKGKRV